jgi:hypothetical protein
MTDEEYDRIFTKEIPRRPVGATRADKQAWRATLCDLLEQAQEDAHHAGKRVQDLLDQIDELDLEMEHEDNELERSRIP